MPKSSCMPGRAAARDASFGDNSFYSQVMLRDADALLTDALQLAPEALAALAASLLESLDEEVDEDAEDEWRATIDRRIRELQAGSVEAIPWGTVRERLEKQIRV